MRGLIQGSHRFLVVLLLELLLLGLWLPHSLDVYRTDLDRRFEYVITDPFFQFPRPSVRWVDPRSLIPHEHTSRPHLEALLSHLREKATTDYLPVPVITASRPCVILDGHHRVAASIRLGLPLIPAWEVDDTEEKTNWSGTAIKVYSRDDGSRMRISKVVRSARQGRVDYGIKGTRHVAVVSSEGRELELERVTPRIPWGVWASSGAGGRLDASNILMLSW
ncbi:hypothetical protein CAUPRSCDRAFT_7486 [Caulochytrium protostelioides]|uniref:ParB-like N-terminal domain-containing protein n=1 Tax=Caulochytrium protostelioides TaxID=1555241 RepID=A0A4V1ITF2_9FUNG|nr:hypothetical protein CAUPRSCDRAFT_7486 [Caulochytrium protostelioides]